MGKHDMPATSLWFHTRSLLVHVVCRLLRKHVPCLYVPVRRYVKPGGMLMLSGILYEQAAEIQAAYGGEFQDFVVKTHQQWAVITAVKRR